MHDVVAVPIETPPRTVLIVRLSAIGDAVFCTTLAEGLKAAWPDTAIDWLGESRLADLLEGHPALRSFIPWRRDEWLALLRAGRLVRLGREIGGLRRHLRRARYDLVVDAQGLAKSRVLTWLAGGRASVGFPSGEGLDFLVDRVVPREGEPGSFAREYRALAERLTGHGFVPRATRPTAGGAGYVALLPFTTRPQKAWPAAYWRSLAGQLDASGVRAVVLGGASDAAAAREMFDGTGAENRVGRTTLGEAVETVTAADAVVGVDTGLAHAAVARGRPAVVLVGASVPYTRGPAGGRVAVLHEALPCSPCGRAPTCAGRIDCMAALTPDRVLAALARVSDGGSSA